MTADQELFELCKQLYEVTEWRGTEAAYTWSLPNGDPYISHPDLERSWGLFTTQDVKGYCPLYTSDYLLEKLPRTLTIKKSIYLLCVLNGNANNDNWIADYVTWGRLCWLHENERAQDTEADTPLKALLKLTLALHKEGLL